MGLRERLGPIRFLRFIANLTLVVAWIICVAI